MKNKNRIVFRRIRGRLVPIRVSVLAEKSTAAGAILSGYGALASYVDSKNKYKMAMLDAKLAHQAKRAGSMKLYRGFKAAAQEKAIISVKSYKRSKILGKVGVGLFAASIGFNVFRKKLQRNLRGE